MICTRLEGGLGNQLFQYAAGRALAHRHSTELILDTAALALRTSIHTPRGLELHRFNHASRLAEPGECSFPAWLKHAPYLVRLVSPWRMYVETPGVFNSKLKELPDQTYLRGYWQSHRYFKAIANELYRELMPTQPLSPQSTSVIANIEASNESSVAIHVRRGDYVSLPSAASFHGALTNLYYETALARIHAQLGEPQFFVFSDDTNWCQEYLPIKGCQVVFVSHNGEADAWQDLVLMSLCRHHIIANSSFSWWGAWLADQRWLGEQRLVIMPSRWFVARNIQNSADRFPPHWIAF